MTIKPLLKTFATMNLPPKMLIHVKSFYRAVLLQRSIKKAHPLKLFSKLKRFTNGILARDNVSFIENGIKIQSYKLGELGTSFFRKHPSLFVRNLPISKLLMGGEYGCPAAIYANLTGDILHPSRSIIRSPHVEFLREYTEHGDLMFHPEQFILTRYWQNAQKCLELQGNYFGATTVDGVIERAKKFTRMLDGNYEGVVNRHETPDGMPVKVRRIKFSDCYEVVDGNHRLAIAIVRGAEQYPCAIMPLEPAITPMQQKVMESSWTGGIERILYQPVDLPELQKWVVVRNCADRLEMMLSFLSQHGISSGSYLDICSSYGWFVDKMSKHGYDAFGVDRDSSAISVGCVAYGIDPSRIVVNNVINFLRSTNHRYDVVSCFSILHHYALGKGIVSPNEFIRLVDSITGSVMFFDTGECHERWFKDSLKEWDAGYIENWLKQNTSFSYVQLLGSDHDGKGRYEGQYGRHLFACYRSS